MIEVRPRPVETAPELGVSRSLVVVTTVWLLRRHERIPIPTRTQRQIRIGVRFDF